MTEGRQRSDWDRTASLLAMQANINRDPKKRRRPFTFKDFHPFHGTARRKRKAPTVEQIASDVMWVIRGERPRRRSSPTPS